ncbi:MAG TPA: hypothetical protein VL501_05900, partial [Pyrinomonadaceae bacterium]|nr:hypothetical protein [Pyrinomonadaceae bacterium]
TAAQPLDPRATPLGTPSKGNVADERSSKPVATPTPGIPSQEEIKRMMSHPAKGDPNTPTMQGLPAMKSNRPLGGKMTGNTNRP